MSSILILGLCNPGAVFDQTYHNIGKVVIELLAKQNQLDKKLTQSFVTYCDALDSITLSYSNSVYMNESGALVLQLYKKLKFTHLIALHDDLMLPVGSIKHAYGGSAKGHNGLRDIINKFSADFHKIRIGIGHPGKGGDVAGYVTSKVGPASWQLLLDHVKALTLDTILDLTGLSPVHI